MINTCTIDDCSDNAFGHGYCNKHYKKWRKYGDPLGQHQNPVRKCSLDDCQRKHIAKGYCSKHYSNFKRTGNPERSIPKLRHYTKAGYINVWNGKDYTLEHRSVMAEMLGRPLLPGENVHHKNGVRDDNRPENLELWVVMQPAGQRVTDLLAFAHEIIERYESAILD